MKRSEIRWGAFNIKLDVEIDRVIKELERIGVKNPTRLEASALIAERSKRMVMTDHQAMEFVKQLRGIYQ